jgi:ABC-type multidrug transport system fused ATPase/permease subunit
LLTIVTFALLMAFIGKFISNVIFMRINRRVHQTIMSKVMHAKIEFFEENTQGRIMTRFSKDMQTLDTLVFKFLEMIDYFVKCILSLIIIVTVSPFIVLIIIVSLLYLIHIR